MQQATMYADLLTWLSYLCAFYLVAFVRLWLIKFTSIFPIRFYQMQIQIQSQQMQNAIHTLDLKVKHSYRS